MSPDEIGSMEILDAMMGLKDDWRTIRIWIAQHGGAATYLNLYDCMKATSTNPKRHHLAPNLSDLSDCLEEMHDKNLVCTISLNSCPHTWRHWCKAPDCPKAEWLRSEIDNLVISLKPLPHCPRHGHPDV